MAERVGDAGRGKAAGVIGLLLLVTLAINAQPAPDEGMPKPLQRDDFRFVRSQDGLALSLDQEIGEVQKEAGSPSNTKVIPNGSDPKWDELWYEYPDFSVSVFRHWAQVRYIVVRSSDFQTSRGIHIGDRESAVLMAYGQGPKVRVPSGFAGKIHAYYLELHDGEQREFSLLFTVKNGVVTSMVMQIPSD